MIFPWCRALLVLLCFISGVAIAATGKSFQIDFEAEPETIGDIKPAFLNFNQEPLPSVPVKEIIRRYRQLFDDTTVPGVRIDVLHRLTNLEAMYGDQKERSAEEERELYKKAIDSYEMIVGTGIYYNRIDELLYQTAKAYDLTGQYEKSLRSLEQLVGLYPNSHLAVEAQFRVGEAYFSLGEYAKAERAYKKSLLNGENTHFYDKAVFMLGWSQFKQAKYNDSGKTFVRILDTLSNTAEEKGITLLELEGIDGETVRDTLRVMSITFSYSSGAEGIDGLIDQVGDRNYAFLLYQHLAAFYLAQERYEDSASAARAFIKRYPNEPKAPLISQAIIKAYEEGRFPLRVWQEKEIFVASYGLSSTAERNWITENDSEVKGWLREYLDELSHYYYVLAQKDVNKGNQRALSLKAADYFRQLVELFPADDRVGEFAFLAGESFSRADDIELAIKDFEYSAYKAGSHQYALEAGYAAILAHNELKRRSSAETLEQQRHRIDSVKMFAEHFPDDERVPVILNDVANEFLQRDRFIDARDMSQAVLDHPLASKKVKRSSWLVNGHAYFQLQQYQSAEHSYSMALSLMGSDSEAVEMLRERIAASIYRQGEIAVASGQRQQAVDEFLRLGRVVPTSRIRSNAQYDAATQLLELKQWRKAIVVLKQFQKEFADHPLTESIPEKLVYAYLENGDKLQAAEQLYVLSEKTDDLERSRLALYQATELYAEAGVKDRSVDLLKRYVEKYVTPFDLYIEAHQNIADYYSAQQNTEQRDIWLSKLIDADEKAGNARDDRSRYLAAQALMVLVQNDLDRFRSATLTLPLKRSLKKKSALLKRIVQQLQQIPQYGIAPLTTEATFTLAEVYRQLASDIMTSEKPSSLDELQLEQYEILLEEQAYPFEEKSIVVHEINIARTKNGIYDKWVKESYRTLSTIVPARYLRNEKLSSYDRKIQ